jgi:general secretion pathway protein N
MIPRFRLALPLLACTLLLLLAAEWLLPGPAALAWQPHPTIPVAVADTSTDANITAWTSTILARPLLSPSRRPAPQPGTAVSETLPRLSAIIVIGGTRHAIFAASGQKPQLVAQGGEIGVYRIETVAPDKVDLLGPNGPVTLKPQFIPAAAPATQ